MKGADAPWSRYARLFFPGLTTGAFVGRRPLGFCLWRRNRFSIYAGGGVGFEHDRQESRFRPIVAHDENGQPILGAEFIKARAKKTQSALAFRTGAIVSLSQKLVVRTGYSYLRRYADERGSQSLEVGLGYRF